ncbi:MAG TPA: hypothetical protein VHC43_04330 [Mycobacteriales bacterium]|nr:hypothetical protein [Mycobacteriales bacterium]
MVFDGALGQILLIGTSAGTPTAGSWLYNGRSWKRISTRTPPRLGGDTPVAWYDQVRKSVLVTGVSNTHVWSYSSAGWRRQADRPVGVVEGATFDLEAGAAVVLMSDGFGGMDTWHVKGDAWSQGSAAGIPAPLGSGYQLVDDGDGVLAIGVPVAQLATLAFAFDGSSWRAVSMQDAPGPLLDAAVTRSNTTGDVLLFGGRSETPAKAFGAMWLDRDQSWRVALPGSSARINGCR